MLAQCSQLCISCCQIWETSSIRSPSVSELVKVPGLNISEICICIVNSLLKISQLSVLDLEKYRTYLVEMNIALILIQ